MGSFNKYQLLPITRIEQDPNQPRRDFGTEGDTNKLLLSIKTYGIQLPIAVHEVEDKRYLIIDGHRRYKCAKKLNWEAIPCIVFSGLNTGELETRRYEMQNNRRPWAPIERSEALEGIKNAKGFQTNRELAKLLGLSESTVANSLQLRKQKMAYLRLMVKYDLSESYQTEFMRLKPKIRKIRDLEVEEIITNIFDRIKYKVIKNAKDLRKLGSILKRATANEEEIYRFLKNPDMTIYELEQRTTQSGFSLLMEELIQKIAKKRQENIAFSSQEENYMEQLAKLLDTTINGSGKKLYDSI